MRILEVRWVVRLERRHCSAVDRTRIVGRLLWLELDGSRNNTIKLSLDVGW